MSGIAGILFCDGQPVERLQLERCVDILSHRGPDGAGVWSDGSVGLIHRMLWTTPESLSEKLPLANASRDLAITADARIDNREELAVAIGPNGRPLSEIADSELILLAYEKWGEGCVEHLLGDFAFAIWDGRKRTLFCARDHMGVRPFYYHFSNGMFVFGSEIKAILTVPQVPRKLNETRVGDYLAGMLNDKEITFYEGILRLPPAHVLTVRDGEIRLREYWALDPTRDIRYKTDEEYAEKFREIFTEAVRCRLRSAFPVGSMLSGGLDSSSIVCVARDLLLKDAGAPLHTISAIFDEVPECDERPYINAVLEGGGLEPHFVHADRISPLVDLERVFWHEDEAFYAPNLFMHWGLYKTARGHDVRVILDGFDGDTAVSHGICFLPELARSLRFRTLAAEILALSDHFGVPRRRLLWKRTLRPLAPDLALKSWRVLCRRDGSGWSVPEGMSRRFAGRIGLRRRYFSFEWTEPAQSVKEDHFRRLTWGVFPHALEVADRAANAFALEPRYPFFDKRLIEYCLALPPEQKLRQGWTRVVMRRALGGVLPVQIKRRGAKSNLGPNFVRGLLVHERERLEAAVFGDAGVVQDYFDVGALRESYLRYVSRGTNGDSMTIWKFVSLALWLQAAGFAACEGSRSV